jgi:hypothetical protein
MGKKSRSGSGTNIPDHISESLETFLWVKILKYLFEPDSGIRDGKNSDPGKTSRIRNTGKKYYRNEREMGDDLVEDDERVPDLDIVLALQAHHQRLRNLLTATAQP